MVLVHAIFGGLVCSEFAFLIRKARKLGEDPRPLFIKLY